MRKTCKILCSHCSFHMFVYIYLDKCIKFLLVTVPAVMAVGQVGWFQWPDCHALITNPTHHSCCLGWTRSSWSCIWLICYILSELLKSNLDRVISLDNGALLYDNVSFRGKMHFSYTLSHARTSVANKLSHSVFIPVFLEFCLITSWVPAAGLSKLSSESAVTMCHLVCGWHMWVT